MNQHLLQQQKLQSSTWAFDIDSMPLSATHSSTKDGPPFFPRRYARLADTATAVNKPLQLPTVMYHQPNKQAGRLPTANDKTKRIQHIQPTKQPDHNNN